MTLADQLLSLLRERRFQAVVDQARASQDELVRDARVAYFTATAFAELGQLSEARQLLQPHVSGTQAEPPALLLASQIEINSGRTEAALPFLAQLNEKQPANAVWWLRLAHVAIDTRRPDFALRSAEVHAMLRAQNVEHALAYTTLLVHAQRHDEALIEFERLLALAPSNALARSMYTEFVLKEFPSDAHRLLAENRRKQSQLQLNAATVRAMLLVPSLYKTEADAAQWRQSFIEAAQTLRELAADPNLDESARWMSLDTTPFFVAFHDADVTQLQNAWGDFVEALIAPLRHHLKSSSAERRPVGRIGIVSNRLSNSSAGRFFNGWIAQLKAAGFEINLYALGARDGTTDQLEAAHRLKHVPKDDISQLRTLADWVAGDQNDALLFPEPQGSPLTVALAALKLAPTQCAAFGNPLTTGLPFIDYFFVPDAAEVENPDLMYREKVIRLAGIGTSIERATATLKLSREQLGFAPGEKIYLVNQQLQKWTPGFIQEVVSILKTDASGKLVYFDPGQPTSSRAFQLALRENFQAHGVDYAKRTQRIPMVDRDVFLAINAVADVALDTFGFGGGATTLDSLSVGLPVVSRQARWLRGRQTAGILNSMGLHRYVVNDSATFAERAIETAHSLTQGSRTEAAAAWWTALTKPLSAVGQSNAACARIYADISEFFGEFNRNL
jgi:protein O-GlcNAc transferase